MSLKGVIVQSISVFQKSRHSKHSFVLGSRANEAKGMPSPPLVHRHLSDTLLLCLSRGLAQVSKILIYPGGSSDGLLFG